MNICFLTSDYVSPTRGGIEKVTFILSNALINRGHSVYIISKDYPKDGDETLNYHFVLPSPDICSNKNLSYIQSFISQKKINIIINQSHHKAVFDLLIRARGLKKVRIISTLHTDPTCFLKDIYDKYDEIKFGNSLWSIKILFSMVSWFVRFPYRYYNRFNSISSRYCEMYERSDAYVLLSESFKRSFVQIAKIKDEKKLYSIGNPIGQIATKYNVKKKKQILFVGRMEFSPKRPDRIIKIWEKVWRKFPDWSLYMLGDGPIKEKLVQYCNKRNIQNIYFAGNTIPDNYYKESAILCMVSSCEGFGLVLTEAQQNSVIPVAYDSFNSVKDIIKNNKTGFLIPAFSKDKYIKILEKLMSNKELRESMIHNISDFQTISLFSIDTIASQWEQLFNSILSDK